MIIIDDDGVIYKVIPIEVLDRISHEIEVNAKYFRENVNTYIADGLLKANKIIDKYRTGSNETQTNEIVYDIGGHMYGAMGGDVIMDILAGKGKE